jgi:cation:H+ antiporter
LTFFLTKYSIELATILNVSPIIIAFTITAAATSIPDTVISVANARKGNVDDVTSNVFGSNIFDILVGLGLPLLIYTVFLGPVEMAFANLEIIFALLGATILTVYFFADSHQLNKRQAIFLLFLYVLFVAYTIILATI